MQLVPTMDSVYLWGEGGNSPCHVIALQLFRPPEGSGPELVDELYERMTDPVHVKRSFRRRPVRSWASGGQFAWEIDDDLDMRLHVRRVGLPRPSRIRELLEFLGDWHAVPLARDRPLWEARLVEGLEDGRFALATKMHHASLDGVNMGRHLLGGFSTDPEHRGGTAPWMVPTDERARPRRRRPIPSWSDSARTVAGATGAFVRSLPRLAGAGVAAVREDSVALPYEAPATRFNAPVSSGRRFAGDRWPLERLRAVARRAGTSSNDVAIAMCGGALRGYLDERGELPEDPLVTMVPVSLAGTDPSSAATDGNSWAAVLATLATDTDDPVERLGRVHAAMDRSKHLMGSLDAVSATAISAVNLAGSVPISIPGVPSLPRPPFNVICSTIPATREPLYLDGCELEEIYPISMVLDGQALNITMVSYVDHLAFGITGCRRSVPRLQRLLVHLENALVDLEKATAR
ncbi:wax ester/triacylglycerol synthase family O-acyltransferase [Actinomycetospora sp.]|uniref:WS/DGAT/MGAT family O-acyltransferase n=1 Tax=Actinomycetospora sp. TaxID=1872135 RepID=UPI002F409D14